MSNKSTNTDWKVDADGLATEIAVAVEDLFEGAVKSEGAEITVDFVNGQRFKVSVEEIK